MLILPSGRIHVGDPGRILKPGLYRQVADAIERRSKGAMVLRIEHEGTISAIMLGRAESAGVHVFDEGPRQIGTLELTTGWIAIVPDALAVEHHERPAECSWIISNEPTLADVWQERLRLTSRESVHLDIALTHDAGPALSELRADTAATQPVQATRRYAA